MGICIIDTFRLVFWPSRKASNVFHQTTKYLPRQIYLKMIVNITRLYQFLSQCSL